MVYCWSLLSKAKLLFDEQGRVIGSPDTAPLNESPFCLRHARLTSTCILKVSVCLFREEAWWSFQAKITLVLSVLESVQRTITFMLYVKFEWSKYKKDRMGQKEARHSLSSNSKRFSLIKRIQQTPAYKNTRFRRSGWLSCYLSGA